MGGPRTDRLDRNFIINGAMKYTQRDIGTVALDIATLYRGIDRFLLLTSGGLTTGTSQRSIIVPPNNITKHSLQLTATPTVITHGLNIEQRIESIYSRDLSNQKVSLSFQVFSESASEAQIIFRTPNVEDDFSVTTNFSNITVPIPSIGSWQEIKLENVLLPSDVVRGMQIIIILKTMTVLSISVDHFITQIKLSIGTEVQGFSNAGRNLIEELEFCQRYFEKSYNVDVAPGTVTLEGSIKFLSNGGNAYRANRSWKVEKRDVPVMTAFSITDGASSFFSNSITGNVVPVFSNVGTTGFSASPDGSASNQEVNGQWTADSEL